MVEDSLSLRVAKLDGRPYHPQDYEECVSKAIGAGIDITLLGERLDYLENHPKLVNGYLSLEQYLLTGILRDDYTGKVLLIYDKRD